MSSVKYLKGVRTRFYNILEKEVSNATFLLSTDKDEVDKNETLTNISMCIDKLQTYAAKLESQSEKVSGAVGESEEEFIDEILENDSRLCETALSIRSQLRNMEEELKEIIKKEKTELEDSKPYKEMQKMLEMQIKMQKEFMKSCEEKSKEFSTSVKLPKLEISSFNGNKLRWTEFWQSFENSVDKNKNLSNVDKFNYLRSKLTGEARSAVAGLSLSNENYGIAIAMLKERFGNVQETINLHYNESMNLKPANETIESLRRLTDAFDRHLRSLEVLRQNINQDIFVSMLLSKLPSTAVRHLEIQKGATAKWTVANLHDLLNHYVIACEKAEKVKKESGRPMGAITNRFNNQRNSDLRSHKGENLKGRSLRSSSEALIVNEKEKSHAARRMQCRYCSNSHWSDECPSFRTIEDRKRCLKGSCYKCLKEGHISNDCKSKRRCVYCSEMDSHHRSLCPKKFQYKTMEESVHVAEEEQTRSPLSSSTEGENALLSSCEIVLMQIARAKVKCSSGSREKEIRILFDSGSRRTYVSEELASHLNLKKEGEQEIRLVTFGSETAKVVRTTTTKLKIELKNGEDMPMTANIVPRITGKIQRKPVNISNMQAFVDITENLTLADSVPKETETGTIDLLIGNDYYLDIISGHRIEIQPGLYLLSSKLGWILTGRMNEESHQEKEINMLTLTYGNNITKTEVFTSVDKSVPQKPDIDDFWKLESIGITDCPQKSNDEMAMENFKQTLIFKEKRYHVTWPWKDKEPDIPDNRALALGRLRSLVTKFQLNPDIRKKYNAVIEDQLAKNVIEKVDKGHGDGMRHYIPHHAVVKPEKTTTKIRIVYDASAKPKPDFNSMNECLYRGPILLQDLCGILMRFRLHKIGIVSDIEKAFLQICLQPNQRDVTRFLWLKDPENPSTNAENIQEYRFCRVPFGIISSPFLLGATVNHHLGSYSTILASQLRRDMYMDNVITGVNAVNDGISLYNKSKQIFAEASMNLREWASNSGELNANIPEEDRDKGEILSVLGLSWNKKDDTFQLKQMKFVDENVVTKRTVVQQVAKMFDPLGFFSPITLKGKLLIQNLWKKHLEWDESLDQDDKSNWWSIRDDLKTISRHKIPRCVSADEQQDPKGCLVCFTDASGKAYAASVYLVQHNRRAELIFSKSRLAPIKATTIPRLELMAMVVGVRCLEFVKTQLRIPSQHTYLYSDSQCALKWIESTKQLPVFVKNRVQEIRKHDDISFRYVNTKNNPADIASRGCDMESLAGNSLWWHGPEWLLEPEKNWPIDLSGSETREDIQKECDFENQCDRK